jgi:hypothetical protein
LVSVTRNGSPPRAARVMSACRWIAHAPLTSIQPKALLGESGGGTGIVSASCIG